jgi:hypothetical protein
VAALLAGALSHLQQPKQLLLGRLAGMVASGGGSGSSRSLQHPAAWQFFVRLLCCLRALQGAGWETLAKASCLCGQQLLRLLQAALPCTLPAAWLARHIKLQRLHILGTRESKHRLPALRCRSGWKAWRECRCRCSA